MWRYLRVFAFFLGYPSLTSYGQTDHQVQHYGDSLYRRLENIQSVEKRAEGLLELSFFWSDYDTAKAFSYIHEASALLAQKSETDYYQGLLSFYRASVDFEMDPERAKKSYLEAERFLSGSQGRRALHYRARLWGSYGALLQREGNATEYMQILLEKVIPIAKNIGDTLLIGNNYQNLAMTLMNMQEYEKADHYYNEAAVLLRTVAGGKEERLTLFVNAARNNLFQRKLNQTRRLLDSASVVISVLGHSSYIPMYHAIEGSYWQKVGNVDKALQHYDRGLKAAEGLQRDDLIASVLFDRFASLRDIGRLAEARRTLLKVLPYIERKPLLRNKQRTYYNLAEVETGLGNYQSAIGWYEKFKLVTDTLFDHTDEIRTLELEKKYQTAEKERELLLVKTENQQQQLSLQRAQGWLVILGSTSAVLSMVGFLWYSSQRTRRKLAEQKELLMQEELKSIKQKEKLNLFNAMVQGQEKERSRIARDLHDSLGGMLASVKLRLSAVAERRILKKRAKENAMELYPIIDQLDQSVTELRRVARNMMPESLLYMGLEAALKDLCRAMQVTGTHITFEAYGLKKEYDQAFLIAIYRIVQELLNNAVKHSSAAHIWVQASDDGGHFYLSVEDNGKGFAYDESAHQGKGIGLFNIRSRVEILNGRIEIDTTPGAGSLFHIDILLNG